MPASGTLVIDKPLRSGQQVYARGGDLVVLAVVNFGAEVIADGNIHVYAPLRGKAHRRRARQYRGAHLHAPAWKRSWCPSPASTAPPKSRCPPTCAGKPAQISLDGKKIVIERDR